MTISHNYLGGSVWRKWDLHVHAPGTKKNDQYQVTVGDAVDTYCERLQASDVAAFGITDYFSTDSYFAVTKRFKEKYPDSRKVTLSNPLPFERLTMDLNAAAEQVPDQHKSSVGPSGFGGRESMRSRH